MQEVPAQWHDLKLFYGELRLQASYGILDWLSADLMWSLRLVRIGFELQDLGRRPIDQPYGEELHHRTETLVGLTDPWLGVRLAGPVRGWEVSSRFGVTLPVGATVENPFHLGREGQSHQHLQFGTGTVDPWAEVMVQRRVDRFTLAGWLLGKAPLYENRHSYRAGAMLVGGLRGTSDLWLPRWQFQLGLLAYHEQPERWSGIVETEGNLGRTDLMLESAITWRFAGPWTLGIGVRVPVQSWIIGAQLNTPAIADITVSRPFQLHR